MKKNILKKHKPINKKMLADATIQSLVKLDPRSQIKNPVMFIVYLGAIFTTILFFFALGGIKDSNCWYIFGISIVLWFTTLFGNFAEAVAEGRGKAQAESLKSARKDVIARKLQCAEFESSYEEVKSSQLKTGDIVLVEISEQIPMDGEVIVGVASVDESAITGESAPVIRESGGDRSAVTGGTTVTSDWLIIKITAEAGNSFLDRMISMVEGSNRKKTPNEIALQILLITLTIIFVVVSATLLPFSKFAVEQSGQGVQVSLTNIIALIVCLAPTTIGALLSSIGIAGMSRLNKANVLATSGRAIEAAGDVDILLLDKTGTITLGNRQATEFIAVGNCSEYEVAECSQLASFSDETAEGRSIVILAKNKYDLRGAEIAKLNATFIQFSARTKMSGVDIGSDCIRKGSADAIEKYVESLGGEYPEECRIAVENVAKAGGTPLVVAKNNLVLGVIYLKDIVKDGVKDKFNDLRKIGIKTIMITGDNSMTAAAIAAEAGVDDYVAEATPEIKLDLIKKLQAEGHLVAMTGDGTNDAPALAQADVAVAMNSGTQAAKEAGNMVDLDSSPTKLIEVVRIGKQLLMTRGALTTFSISNDIAKYFAIIPVLFASIYPGLEALNFMNLTSPSTAILSSIIYNALIIVGLIPLSLKGVKYKEQSVPKMLKNNLLKYGVGGMITPFIFIKLFDLLLTVCGVM